MTDILYHLSILLDLDHSKSRTDIAKIAACARDEIEQLAAGLVAALRWHESTDKALSKGGNTTRDWQRGQHIEQICEIKDALGPHLERIEKAEADRWRKQKIAEHEAAIAALKAETPE